MSVRQPSSRAQVPMLSVTGDPIRPFGADVDDDAGLSKRQRAQKRRQTAAAVRRAAGRATRGVDVSGDTIHAIEAASQSALTRALGQADAKFQCSSVVWRYLSADAKPLDDWAASQTVATHAHYTPFCPIEPEEDSIDEQELVRADLIDPDRPPSVDPVDDSLVGDMLLLTFCFGAFPLSLFTSGLPSAAVAVLALFYKLVRRHRFSTGRLLLILAVSLVAIAAANLRPAQSANKVSDTNIHSAAPADHRNADQIALKGTE
jgi:hypothetical protein